MSQYYSGKRQRNIFNPDSREPFALSRSRLENFTKCARCFYMDRRLGVDQPPGYPFSLNSAVDKLLKKEFDIHRTKGEAHPLMKQYRIDAVPFTHEKMDEWRDVFKGVRYFHEPSNFIFTGGVDDIWQNSAGELHVVDYKSTSKDGEVTLDAEWQDGYKRQAEMYQWLLRRNGFAVSPIAYFVYVNGKTDVEAFDGRLEFDVKIIPYTGSDSWVEQTLMDARACLVADVIPDPDPSCDFCVYRFAVLKAEQEKS